MNKKILTVVGITILFLGLAIQPSLAVQPETEIDIEPKDYLFQTIIDIANNPNVKNLLEQYKYDLCKVDIDRSVYRKLLLRNLRPFRSMIFTKPSLTYEYLDKSYNQGLEVTNIIGEDKVLEIMESVEITDTKLFDELNNIISKDEELSHRLAILKEMNKEIKPDAQLDDRSYPIICAIIFFILIYNVFKADFFEFLFESIYESFPFILILFQMIYVLIALKSLIILFPCVKLFVDLGCLWY